MLIHQQIVAIVANASVEKMVRVASERAYDNCDLHYRGVCDYNKQCGEHMRCLHLVMIYWAWVKLAQMN